ncbi:uncharacterized protein YjcR [Paenibacillus phyllosphaerae]|uniref:Uncharacterized protein YjcR n=1 Tax=Paenibacillus phyllosphaerae TaxID=274593 RepID=A0A7W5AVN6_9BACL|nr:hypothetical protein [Paenibacillus phyllosphaerae]MBB3109650.1 uncharacterized protein YjcR [Paenibacillus phyllosphaerae]
MNRKVSAKKVSKKAASFKKVAGKSGLRAPRGNRGCQNLGLNPGCTSILYTAVCTV